MGFFDSILSIFWPYKLPAPDADVQHNKKEASPPPPEPEFPEPEFEISQGPVVPPTRPPPDIGALREWRLTDYYLADQQDHRGSRNVPILDRYGQVIDYANAGFFASLSLEGSGICKAGKLLNVDGGWVSCDPNDYASVWEYHQKYLSKRPPSYSGIQVKNDKVTRVLAFHEVPQSKFGKGFGICNGIPLDPYRTLAADIGKGKKSDPLYKAVGGVCPVGTEVYIHEFNGFVLPDGTTHDGWFVVNDTGGGIFGAHFDVFTGHKFRDTKFKVPAVAHVWFVGIERLPTPYTYGLRDV